MIIWVDADACPAPIKEILYRAATRLCVELILVANQRATIPKSPYIKFIQVSHGFDVADQYIIQNMSAHDLVITADIPLASEVIKHHGQAINPRGTLYSKENIGEKLSMRNLREELRSIGSISGGPQSFNKQDRQAFANALDQILTKALKK